METELVCFRAPLNICLPLSYGPSSAVAEAAIEEEAVQALLDSAETGCHRCLLDEFFGEDWE